MHSSYALALPFCIKHIYTSLNQKESEHLQPRLLLMPHSLFFLLNLCKSFSASDDRNRCCYSDSICVCCISTLSFDIRKLLSLGRRAAAPVLLMASTPHFRLQISISAWRCSKCLCGSGYNIYIYICVYLHTIFHNRNFLHFLFTFAHLNN